MARIKNEYGLTPQQEMFCQYVVDAYGVETRGILVAAYRKAYNCKTDAKASTHYSSASQLMNNPKIAQRLEQLRQERATLATISRERIISDDVRILELDPLLLWIEDEQTHQWRMRYLHEIPKDIRRLLKFTRNGRRLIPDVDKDAAKKRLIEVLGYASAKDLNITAGSNIVGEIRIGFDEDK
ncbi:MAG: hypothetical protein HDS64_08850 [Bacteroidales bacterium]|nr:hypothetical protein [Bacteroidales bacterium]MBD5360720.1 hypothetical protein [Bacteroides sp.]MBD5364825.1 hypothetical protein [Bacteroides sp.]